MLNKIVKLDLDLDQRVSCASTRRFSKMDAR